MEVLSSSTGGAWLKESEPEPPRNGVTPKPDPAEQECRRILSDIFRCNNLVVLAGLGTSLCLKVHGGASLAPTMASLWARVQTEHKLLDDPLWEDLLVLVRHNADDKNLETLLSRCRLAQQFLEGDELMKVETFIKLAEREIVDAVDFLAEGHPLPEHSEFLRRAARRSNRKLRTKVFTTNYDRCFEEAARQGRYVVIDGFSQTVPPTFDAVYFTYDIVRRDHNSDNQDFVPNVFHLYKLHGSIDWERNTTTGEIHKVHEPENPLLIYPRSSKYELAFEQPYLEMMSALQTALREPDTGLLVLGFGFNDNHLAEPILSAIRANLALKVAVVSPTLAPWDDGESEPGGGDVERNTYLKRVRNLIHGGDARLAMVNASFEDVIKFIPDIAAETDLEKHVDRLRKLGA